MSIRTRFGEWLMSVSLRILGDDYFAKEMVKSIEPISSEDDDETIVYPAVTLNRKALSMLAVPVEAPKEPDRVVQPLKGSIAWRLQQESRG